MLLLPQAQQGGAHLKRCEDRLAEYAERVLRENADPDGGQQDSPNGR